MWPQFQFLLVRQPTFSEGLALPRCVTHVQTFVAVSILLSRRLLSLPGHTLMALVFGICHEPWFSFLDIHWCVPPKQGPPLPTSPCRVPNTAPGRAAAPSSSERGPTMCMFVSVSLSPWLVVLVLLISTTPSPPPRPVIQAFSPLPIPMALC